MSRFKRGLAIVAGLFVSLGLAVAVQPGSAGAAGPTFTVMNTSESPPDGVYFRYSPYMSDTDRDYGWGVFMNEQVQLQCYAWGEAVGAYSNRLWYWVLNVSRPTNYDGRSNQGMLNAHFINDGLAANQIDAGVPACVNNRPPVTPPPPPPAQIYYSPYNAGSYEVGSPVKTVYSNQFSTNCTSSLNGYNAAKALLASGQVVSTLGGWSKGRVGIIYFLKNAGRDSRTALTRVNYIIMLDPGAYGEMDCDRSINAGSTLADWLMANRSAHLVIISSSQVTQLQSSKGIQEVYFNAIRNRQAQTGVNLRGRVLVCNYSFTHVDAFQSGKYWISHQIGASTASCPTLRDSRGSFSPTARWHP